MTTPPTIGRVSTSDRQDEPAGATTRTTYVISKAEMLAHDDVTVADALTRTPGVTLQQYGALGALASVSIRGSSNGQVLVLLDGRPLAGAQTAGIDLDAISTTGVSRIEVVEGGGSTLYGTGAIGGVINIITTARASDVQAPIVALQGGSYGVRSISIDTPHVSFERLVAANNYAYPALGGNPAGVRIDDSLASTTARVQDTIGTGPLRITGSAGLNERHLGIPGELDFGIVKSDRQNNTGADARISVALQRAQAVTTLDLGAQRQTLHSYDFDPADALTVGSPFADYSTESDLTANLRNVVVSGRNRLVTGIDLLRGVARNDGGAGTVAVTGFAQTAVYGQDSIELPSATRLTGGVRAERDGGIGGAITPSFGIAQQLGGGLALKANYTRSFRAPTQEDLFYPGFANPTLQPERATGYDVTLSTSRVLGGASLGYFTNFGIDQIVLNPAADYALPFGPGNEPLVNAQRTSTAGFIAHIATLPLHHITTTLDVTDTYRAQDLTASEVRLAYVPVIGANLELAYEPASATTRIAGFGFDAHTVGDRFARNGSAPTYTRLDTFVRVRAARDAIFSLHVFDLLDERYDEIAHYPTPGRTFAVELSTR